MKGISPFIATILIIAITVGIGSILSVWLPSLITTQTQTVGASAESQAKCTSTTLKIDQAAYHVGTNLVNVTVEVATGSQNLQNLTITVEGAGITNTSGKGYTSTYFSPGDINVSSIPVSSSVIPPDFVTATAICQGSVTIIATCKSTDSCMVAS